MEYFNNYKALEYRKYFHSNDERSSYVESHGLRRRQRRKYGKKIIKCHKVGRKHMSHIRNVRKCVGFVQISQAIIKLPCPIVLDR